MMKLPPRVVLSASALLALAGSLGWSAAAANPDDHAPAKKPAVKAPRAAFKPASTNITPPKASKPSHDDTGHGAAKSPASPAKNSHDDEPAEPAEDASNAHDDDHGDEAANEAPKAKALTEPKPLGHKSAGANATATIETAPTADEAWTRLREGNQRWATGQTMNPNSNAARREETADGQHPFAAVLTCADSRLPVERVFDQGVGDVFVVRVAGNIAGTSETGTMEYGAEHLKVPLLVVMGHTKCGAVKAAAGGGDAPPGALGELVSQVKPAVERAQRLNPEAESDSLVAEAIKENVWQTIFTLLKTSPVLAERARSGELKIVGAVCDVSSGKVQWLGEHPWQQELVAAFAKKSDAREGDAHSAPAHASSEKAPSQDSHAEPAAPKHSMPTKAATAKEVDDHAGGH